MEFAFDIEKTAFWHFALILFTYRDFESGDKADFRIRTSANTVSSIGTMGYDSFFAYYFVLYQSLISIRNGKWISEQ